MPLNRPLRWDIFCQVIDNFGDVGVCWRAAAELAARGQQVRLWLDDASALAWMAPAPHPAGLSVHAWPDQRALLPADGVGDVVIEAFGCTLPEPLLQAIAQRHAEQGRGAAQTPVWINLEYLSAEPYVERCHRLPSLLMSGPAAGLTRWFFYPGFTPRTGGLLREAALGQRQAAFDRQAWRAARGIDDATRLVSLFCYEPPALPDLLAQLQAGAPASHLLVTPGRAANAVRAVLAPQQPPALACTWLTPCAQPAFDEMLWACDLNLVRGEDSLVRALWAGQAFVWQIYPQHDNAHHAKLDAFLDWLEAPPSLRLFHHVWNGMLGGVGLPLVTPQMLDEWRDCAQAARARQWVRSDLVSQLQQFVAEKS
ncbi:elongation factor P maturation arginine rhamnosyltransferase EarP [Pantoea sp. 18069]|uniref:elongation factor P maturation arginine rhamnosyltransferase EarP n=1 Tax=Pantoea sp. 18069 TaxID=2681415 RepID=UPI001356BF4D|nr:elongation factor P maturation arginine rhamnosyltransferase EarP [Pantoea sp. 18069]